MTMQDSGGPAFPIADPFSVTGPGNVSEALRLRNGMTLRQYAAIKLRVPDSGTDWLDRMILKAKRDDLAAQAMQGMLADSEVKGSPKEFAERAYTLASAMLRLGRYT